MAEQRLGAHPVYVCPACHGPLEIVDHALECPACRLTYPLVRGIPDFVREDPALALRPRFRWLIPLVNLLAGFYETPLWYTPILRLYGGPGAPDFQGLIEIMRRKMDFPERGMILDAACGPATWGRRIATTERAVYGIDLTWPMLHKGSAYLADGHIENVHLARSSVETLPFRDAQFVGAVCGGALHLFPDTVRALSEIGRTMKPGARLVVMTFTTGNQSLLRLKNLRERARKDHGLHIFEMPRLEADLARAGFERFEPEVFGSVLVFTALRGQA